MKTKINTLLVCLALYCMALSTSYAQCLPMIKIDGNDIIADENSPSGIKLPSWLAAGQTLAQSQNVYSIAVIEFTINGTALDYSQNKSVTTVQTVPAGKVWKLESIHKDPTLTQSVSTTYTSPGTYSFTPTCSGRYLLKVWGAGGGGGGGASPCNLGGTGGGGGGYSEGYYNLLSTSTYTVTVGAGGTGATFNSFATGSTGGTSSVGSIVNAVGGTGGIGPGGCGTPPGGLGGFGITESGGAGAYANAPGGNGGKGGGTNGGAGGAGGYPGGAVGTSPGGGGGGRAYNSNVIGGSGGDGKVEITLSSNSSSAAKVPCVAMYLYNTNCGGACPAGWTDAGCGPNPGGSYASYVRTCYRCD
jgi:hypothetical protein